MGVLLQFGRPSTKWLLSTLSLLQDVFLRFFINRAVLQVKMRILVKKLLTNINLCYSKTASRRRAGHHYVQVIQRLKSRHRFIKEVFPLDAETKQVRISLWKEEILHGVTHSAVGAPGHDLP